MKKIKLKLLIMMIFIVNIAFAQSIVYNNKEVVFFEPKTNTEIVNIFGQPDNFYSYSDGIIEDIYEYKNFSLSLDEQNKISGCSISSPNYILNIYGAIIKVGDNISVIDSIPNSQKILSNEQFLTKIRVNNNDSLFWFETDVEGTIISLGYATPS